MKPHIDTLKRWTYTAVSASMLAAFMVAGTAQAAMNRQQPVNWGGGSSGTGRSSGVQHQANAPHYRQWRPLWRFVWSRAEQIYDMHPAQSVAGTPNCPANLGIGATVEQTIDAINAKHYGDAVKGFGQFQSRLLCLTIDGAHGVDFALSAFNAFAMRELTGREREQAVAGSFNLGLIAFDGIQYSGRSWWLPVMAHDHRIVASVIRNYPGQDLGLWFYDVHDGQLHQLTFGGHNLSVYLGLMHALSHPGAFGQGECSLLGMAAAGFTCGGGGGNNGGLMGSGGGGGGGFAGSGGGGGLSCAVSAAMNTGMHGALTCMARASGLGGLHMPATAASHVQIHGVLDTQCTISDGNGNGDTQPQLKKFVWQESGSTHEHADSVGEAIWNWFVSLFSSSKGGGGGGAPAPGGLGKWSKADTADVLSRNAAQKAREERMKQRAEEYQYRLHHLKKFKNTGGHAVNGGAGGGCGSNGTNTAMQVAALYSCMSGRSGGMSATGPRFPGSGGGTNPYAIPGPGGAAGGGESGAPSSLLSCAMQGGGLVRTSRNDKRCQQSYCAQGQNCSCNGSGGSAPSSVKAAGRRVITSPNNMNRGAIDFGRNHVGNIGGFHGPKIPTFGGGPSKR